MRDLFNNYNKKESIKDLIKETVYTVKIPKFVEDQIVEDGYKNFNEFIEEKIADNYQTHLCSVNYKVFSEEIKKILDNKILLSFNLDNDINSVLNLISFDKEGLELFLGEVNRYDPDLVEFFSQEDNISNIRTIVRLYCKELLSKSEHPMKSSLINIIENM